MVSPRAAAHSAIRFQEPIGNSSGLTVSQQFTRPNTAIHYSHFTPHDTPMPASPLDRIGWKKDTEIFPDHRVTSLILGICRYGARISYEGPRTSINIYPNLSTAEEDEEIVTADIVSELADNCLKCYSNRSCLPTYYKASPLDLVDKFDGTKPWIYHLCYPPEKGSSINCRIPEYYGTIAYSNIAEAVSWIQSPGKISLLIKRDSKKHFTMSLSGRLIHLSKEFTGKTNITQSNSFLSAFVQHLTYSTYWPKPSTRSLRSCWKIRACRVLWYITSMIFLSCYRRNRTRVSTLV